MDASQEKTLKAGNFFDGRLGLNLGSEGYWVIRAGLILTKCITFWIVLEHTNRPCYLNCCVAASTIHTENPNGPKCWLTPFLGKKKKIKGSVVGKLSLGTKSIRIEIVL